MATSKTEKKITFPKNKPVKVSMRGTQTTAKYLGPVAKANGEWHNVKFPDGATGLYRASQLQRAA
jgi:hypothetical protein